MRNQSVENQAPVTSCSVEVMFAWVIDGLCFEPTQSLTLSAPCCQFIV